MTDYGNNRVQKFTSAGVFLTKWGSAGNGDGQFAGPAGVSLDVAGSAVDRNGNEGPHALVGPNQTTDVPGVATAAFALEGVRPNPATRARMVVQFTLPGSEPASLELLDVAGRRVRERAVGAMGAGRHAVDLADGERLAPGLYFVRLSRGADQRVIRTVVYE